MATSDLSLADLSLAQVEEEIKKAEEALRVDLLRFGGSDEAAEAAVPTVTSPERPQPISPTRKRQSRPEIPVERRREILASLERSHRPERGPDTTAEPPLPPPPPPPPAGETSLSPSNRYYDQDSRQQLLDRLVTRQQDSGRATSPAPPPAPASPPPPPPPDHEHSSAPGETVDPMLSVLRGAGGGASDELFFASDLMDHMAPPAGYFDGFGPPEEDPSPATGSEHEHEREPTPAPEPAPALAPAPDRRSRKAGEDVPLGKEYTFAPQINEVSQQLSAARPPFEERLQQLARDKSQRLAEQQRQRQQRQTAAQREECTFQPQLVAKAPPGMESRRRATKKRACDRLFEDASAREASRAEVAGAVQEAVLRQHTFRPELNPHTDEILEFTGYRPIQERLGDIQRDAQRHIHSLRVSRELGNPDLTFTPEVNPTSHQLAEATRVHSGGDGDDVGTRLAREASAIAERRLRLQQAHEQRVADAHGFRPALSRGSERIAQARPEIGQQSFLDRQTQWLQECEVAERKRKQRLAKQDRDLFRPDIGASAVRAPQEVVRQDIDERVQRLASDHISIEERRKQAEEEYYRRFSFRPQINAVSRAIGKSTAPSDMMQNVRGKVTMTKVKAAAEARLKAECPFQPKINASSRRVQRPSSTHSRAAEQAAWRQQQRAEREIKELEECTFEPSFETKERPIAQPKGPVVVRGLARYLELQGMARRKEEERALHEARAFKVKGGARGRAGVTRPQPFNLSSSRDPKLRERLKAEAEQRELQGCTFNPRTNESVHRAMLEQILDDSSLEESSTDPARSSSC